MRIIQIKNIAASFWSYYDDTLPANIMVIGETACDENYYISRTSSRIMAIEYILSGSGTLQMEGETFHPKRNTAILLPKHSCHTYYSASDDFWVKKWIVFDGTLMQTLIDTYLPKNVCCFENCNLLPYFQKIEKNHTNGRRQLQANDRCARRCFVPHDSKNEKQLSKQ